MLAKCKERWRDGGVLRDVVLRDGVWKDGVQRMCVEIESLRGMVCEGSVVWMVF